MEYLVFGAPVVSLLVGVFASQKIKDMVNGVPSDVRSALNKLESGVLAKVKTTRSAALSDVHAATLPVLPPATAPIATVAPVTPPAPKV